MAVRYTEEQLNTIDKSLLIQMFLNQQEQLETLTTEARSLNEKMQLVMEQLVLANKNRFGRSSEKMTDLQQISFMEVDGNWMLRKPKIWMPPMSVRRKRRAKRNRIWRAFRRKGLTTT